MSRSSYPPSRTLWTFIACGNAQPHDGHFKIPKGSEGHYASSFCPGVGVCAECYCQHCPTCDAILSGFLGHRCTDGFFGGPVCPRLEREMRARWQSATQTG